MLTLTEHLNQPLLFATARVSVLRWSGISDSDSDSEMRITSVLSILSPAVTKALPEEWQSINTFEQAKQWINERAMERNFYAISTNEQSKIIGFLFLYREAESSDLRLGYLLDQAFWGKGLGTELISGLVNWCRSTQSIQSLSGGVEEDNIGSIKVLEKCGFHKAKVEMPPQMYLYKIGFEIKL